MGWLAWLKGKSGSEDPRLVEWRRKWSAAIDAVDAEAVRALRSELDGFGVADDDIEVEREMLEAVDELLRLRGGLERSGLPSVETGHRIIGTDTCHFSAPASMPDDEAQPAGRLLLTNARAIFAGGARTKALPWHGVARIIQSDRDIVLIRKGQDSLHRFRCNTYADAICGAFIARCLVNQARPGCSSGLSAVTPSLGSRNS